MKATFCFVAWWKHENPDFIMSGPFVDAAQAIADAERLRAEGHRHAQPIQADIELHNVGLLRA